MYLLQPIGCILLGFLSAMLSYYNRNLYVKFIDDIWGREEEESVASKVGRGFIYGLLFPLFFVLLLIGLIVLVIFVVIAGIIAALVLVAVWITEKLLPNQLIGNAVISIFHKLDIKGAPVPETQTTIDNPPVVQDESQPRV